MNQINLMKPNENVFVVCDPVRSYTHKKYYFSIGKFILSQLHLVRIYI